MVDDIDLEALIAEARARSTGHARQNPEGSVDLARRMAAALVKLRDERDSALREMHQRELHHFEMEQELAGALAVIERVRAFCRKALAVKVDGSSEGETAMAALAAVITREALDAAPSAALNAVKAEALREAVNAAKHDQANRYGVVLPDADDALDFIADYADRMQKGADA